MSDNKPSRGIAGTVLKLLRANDYTLTVTGRREISPHYLRLSFDAGGMLDDRALHPTMWIRMWFADGDELHQRGYTLVDPESGGRHRRHRVRAARRRGIQLGTERRAGGHRRGDGAGLQLPAARSAAGRLRHRRRHRVSCRPSTRCSTAIGDTPARVFLEAGHDDDKQLPVAAAR